MRRVRHFNTVLDPSGSKLKKLLPIAKRHEAPDPKPKRTMWVVVTIMVPFWVPIIIWHLFFRVPKRGP